MNRFYHAGSLSFRAFLRLELNALPFAQTFEAGALY